MAPAGVVSSVPPPPPHSPQLGQWGLLTPSQGRAAGHRVSRVSVMAPGYAPKILPWSFGTSPLGGHLTLGAQQRRQGLLFPLSSLVPTHSWTHGFPTHGWDLLPWGSGNVPPMSISEPLSLLGRPRRTPHRDQCGGPLCPPVAWLAPFPACDCCSSSQGGSKSQMRRLHWAPL